MILGFKETFEDRTPTFFEQKIFAGVGIMPHDEMMGSPKIHSMRAGDRWRAGMSIQMAYGVRTPHYRQFNKGIECLSTCISTQDVFMTFYLGRFEVTIDDVYTYHPSKGLLVKNDGLSENEFMSWFFPKGTHEWSGQIIHWTDFKY